MATKSLSEILHGETRFGRLTVIGEARRRDKYRRALCRCDCGTELEVHTFSLTSGRTVSCGCFHREQQIEIGRAAGKRNHKHGYHGTPEYRAWRAAIDRCERKANPAYERYGGRGIRVCERWRHSFEAFIKDIGPRPSPDRSLDRIDNDGNYEPGNCRWATRAEQNQNRRPFEIGKPKA